MGLFLSKQELSFQERVRKFASDYVAPISEKVEREEYFPREILTKLGQKRLLGAPFSVSDGGLGMGWSYEILAAEEISAVSAATEMARLASAALYSAPLASFGNKDQKREFLGPVLSGEKVGALALTEPSAGSDAASIRTLARRQKEEFVLTGEKRFITNGGVADFLFVFAITSARESPRNSISALIVPRESAGVQVVKDYGLLGMHGARVTHLRFRNVRVPARNLVGRANQGFSVLLDELDKERPTVASGMVGVARSALNAAIAYSASRRQFGRPIREFEGVSFKVADMATRLEASRLLVLKAARLLDAGKRIRKEGAMAKLFATEAAFEITNEAVQIHGGIGYTKELPVERYFRDARFMLIGGGTSEIMRYLIQREVYREAGLKVA